MHPAMCSCQLQQGLQHMSGLCLQAGRQAVLCIKVFASAQAWNVTMEVTVTVTWFRICLKHPVGSQRGSWIITVNTIRTVTVCCLPWYDCGTVTVSCQGLQMSC